MTSLFTTVSFIYPAYVWGFSIASFIFSLLVGIFHCFIHIQLTCGDFPLFPSFPADRWGFSIVSFISSLPGGIFHCFLHIQLTCGNFSLFPSYPAYLWGFSIVSFISSLPVGMSHPVESSIHTAICSGFMKNVTLTS